MNVSEKINPRERTPKITTMRVMMLKKNPSKGSIAVKRYRAGLDPKFLAEILAGSQNLEKR